MADSKSGLTVKKIESIKAVGRYFDSNGLALYVYDSGQKYWKYRYDLNKKRREMGLGSFPELTLMSAREMRDECRKLVKQGIDPIDYRTELEAAAEQEKIDAEKNKALLSHKAITFEQCADEFRAKKKAEWSNAKHRQQWKNTLNDYAHPHIGHLKVGDVDKAGVLECLTPIWTTKNETATRVRQRIETILDYAKAMDYRTGDNPAAWKGCLEPILPKPSKVKKVSHHKALPYDKMPAFMSQLKTMDGLGAQALRLTILTAARTNETLQAKWSEVDLTKKTWTIPKERMKAGKEHRIALSTTAIEIIKSLPKINDYLFAGMKHDKSLSNVAMIMVLRRMERTDITVHGFRSTFRDWIAEQTHYPARVAETALAHQLKDGAEKAYQRGDLIKKRAEMMEAWASYCNSRKAKVVRLPA